MGLKARSIPTSRHPRPPAPDEDLSRLVVHEVDKDRWRDLERLFEGRGGPRNCWCMVWRSTPEESRHTDGASRKQFLKHRVDAGVPIGLLAYLEGDPVAWCSIAPRDTYRRVVSQPTVSGGATADADDDDRTYFLACFFIKSPWRRRGMMRRLIEAAATYAKSRGATLLDASPVDLDSPSYRFMGFRPVFEQAGFREIGRAGTRRHLMRRSL